MKEWQKSQNHGQVWEKPNNAQDEGHLKQYSSVQHKQPGRWGGTQQNNSIHTVAKVRIVMWKNILSPSPSTQKQLQNPRMDACKHLHLRVPRISERATALRTHNGTNTSGPCQPHSSQPAPVWDEALKSSAYSHQDEAIHTWICHHWPHWGDVGPPLRIRYTWEQLEPATSCGHSLCP